ncbi:hypothetical protein Goshw_029276 [Gossypium schwendimanii]|uniref:BHLH domain-containing protein n=1 Tax=Gossypium schwendimanii TaxID=34291 RepID=A0A7J9L6C3_GOSSC|nr:hypothetical protein [Gossypium schwendimanii]
MALAKDPICSVQTSTLLEDGSDGFIFQAVNYQPEQPHSLINFKDSGYDNFIHSTNGSLLSFEQNEKGRQHTTCLRTSDYKHGHSMVDQWDPRAVEDFSCLETASNGDWLYYDEAVFADSSSIQDPGSPAADLKRPHVGGSNQALKKQCTNETKKGKTKSEPSKEPQSIAAKNRRERISERLKILQELVPNGSKVDLVTMLEKAISYVKFLQLQVKVLATDEFWPVQGGKAPDISQVREAIDAILSSQKQRNSTSE